MLKRVVTENEYIKRNGQKMCFKAIQVKMRTGTNYLGLLLFVCFFVVFLEWFPGKGGWYQ